MATLGRDIYQKFLLDGDCGKAEEQFVNAIRFSTHGDFYCKNTTLIPKIHSYPHFHDYDEKLSVSSFYRIFSFRGNFFEVSSSDGSKATKATSRFVTMYIKEKAENYRTILCADFIVNADHSIEYVCSIDVDGMPKHDPFFILDILDQFELAKLSLEVSTIITLNFNKVSDEQIQISLNNVSAHWEYYRVIGINPALLVIQTLLGRNVKTLPLVDTDNILFDKEKPKYLTNSDMKVWFDLDETLVCRWLPIRQSIQLLRYLRKKGYGVQLITRHTFDIRKTLRMVGLEELHFDRIVKVKEGQKKSSYISSSDVFIDNEFAERMDVRLESKAIVLDVDQIDFFN